MKNKLPYRERRLVKVLADTTNKYTMLFLTLFCLASLISLYVMIRFLVPHTFTSLKGVEKCSE